MSRVRWYRFDIDTGSLQRLANGMLENQFTPGRQVGFQLDAVRKNRISGRYIEKLELIDEIVDPWGRKQEFSHTEYRVLNFELRTQSPGLQVVNSPRGCRSFYSQLGGFLDFQVSLEPLVSPLNEWLHHIASRVQELRVIEACYQDVTLDKDIVADIRLRGNAGLLDAAERISPASRGILERVSATWLIRGKEHQCELFHDARLTTKDETDLPAVFEVCRDALQSIEPYPH